MLPVTVCQGCAFQCKFGFEIYTTQRIMPKPNATKFLVRPLVRDSGGQQILKPDDKVMCKLHIPTEGV